MTLGILLSIAAATSYTFNTLFLTLLGRKAGISATRYIFLMALAAIKEQIRAIEIVGTMLAVSGTVALILY